jgi:hypothetical protein
MPETQDFRTDFRPLNSRVFLVHNADANVASWHFAAFAAAAKYVAYWVHRRQTAAQGLNKYAAFDPEPTSNSRD